MVNEPAGGIDVWEHPVGDVVADHLSDVLKGISASRGSGGRYRFFL